ncbi:hypothetical protein Hanom_Chr17g01529631 [Helianthus anomalus]
MHLSEDTPLWIIFNPDFKGKVEVLACADGEEGFNFTIRDNFRLPGREATEAALPQGKEILGPWETLMPRVSPNNLCSRRVRIRRRRRKMLVFLLWCWMWQVSLVLV